MELSKSSGDIVEVVLQERDCEKSSMWKCPKCGREFKKKEQSHYCGEKPKTIDEYILSQDTDKQEDLRYIRQILHSALPEAEERISWSMPTYWKGHNILHFAASKKHIGFYPGPAAVVQFSKELQEYKTDKGTVRIPYGKVDAALIEKNFFPAGKKEGRASGQLFCSHARTPLSFGIWTCSSKDRALSRTMDNAYCNQ